MRKWVAQSSKAIRNPHVRKLIVLGVVLIPFLLAITSFINGHLVFWYDNSRDLYAAWNNLQKISLIGPTSGIPGLFYGPYWIWLLSFGLLFSKDPIIVTFLTATLPYFILFPLIWFRFAKFFGRRAVIIGWLLFIFSTGITYATQLWNPHPAPLITLAVLYLLLTINFKKRNKATLLLCLLTGFLLGLVINFHISFGIGFSFGVVLFVLWQFVRDMRHRKTPFYPIIVQKGLILLSLSGGLIVSFAPTLIFELRHNFQQVHVLLNTLTQYGAVIEVKGLSKPVILQEFIATLSKLLHVNPLIALLDVALMLGSLIWLSKKKRLKLTESDKKILALLAAVFIGIGSIYFTARNAVWTYHFIGVEIFFLLLITFLLSKLAFFRDVFTVWAAWVMIVGIITLLPGYFKPSYFHSQKAVVQTIINDAQKKPYEAAAYTNASYSHETAYLFRWLADKKVSSDPNLTPQSDTIYLILPVKENANTLDFINNRTPSSAYTTAKSWDIDGNFKVIKRVNR